MPIHLMEIEVALGMPFRSVVAWLLWLGVCHHRVSPYHAAPLLEKRVARMLHPF